MNRRGSPNARLLASRAYASESLSEAMRKCDRDVTFPLQIGHVYHMDPACAGTRVQCHIEAYIKDACSQRAEAYLSIRSVVRGLETATAQRLQHVASWQVDRRVISKPQLLHR